MRSMLLTLAALLVALAAATLQPAPTAHAASTTVCSVYCDTRDPSLAKSETFPVPNVDLNGRLLELHVDDVSGMAWASIDDGQTGDSVWIDRTWDGGNTWDGLLGEASIPSTWTGTRTLMYNQSDPVDHRRGMVRACGDAGAVTCTQWAHVNVCDTYCDGRAASQATGDTQPVSSVSFDGRTVTLHVEPGTGMGWASISGGQAGDQVWLDRSWDQGADWNGGSLLGYTTTPSGSTGTETTMVNTTDLVGRLYGGAIRACGNDGSTLECTAFASPDDNLPTAAANALMYYYDPNNAWWPSSWWNSAAALTSLIDYLKSSGSTEYDWVVGQTYTVNDGSFPAGTRSGDAITGDFISAAIDDSQWWALAWIDAYDLTGNQTYLNTAIDIANYATQYWDTSTCGGGVWWNTSKTYKNSVTNALYIRLTAALHNRISGDTVWLSRAQTAWNWFVNSGLINSSGLVNDGLTSSCANNGQTVWSYNQGLAIGAAVELWKATGNASVLSEGEYLANSALNSTALVSNGILTESCDTLSTTCDDDQKQFKGIFARYLGELATATGSATYANFLQTQSAEMWAYDRNSFNDIGERWDGQTNSSDPNIFDWRTTSSALDALDAAANTVTLSSGRKQNSSIGLTTLSNTGKQTQSTQ